MDQSLLPHIYPLRFHLKTIGPFRVPEYKGALFRGGFGQFFRDLVCVTRAPVCTGCPHLGECKYSLVFETRVDPAKMAVLRKYPNAPHPFVMVPPLDPRTSIPSDVELTLDVTLIGRGLQALPHFLVVFDEMGRSGRYGGRFRLSAVRSALPAATLIFDGATRRVAPTVPSWHPPNQPAEVERIQLSFLTPLRMRTAGQYNGAPDFVALAHALLRRVHLLSAIHGTGLAQAPWMTPLLAAADAIRTERSDFLPYEWQRTSGRQHRRIAMDGVIGNLVAAGDLTSLAPFFSLGEWINIGSGTSMGLGKYRLTLWNQGARSV